MITTKKGKAGKTALSANFNRGFGQIVNGYDLMNTEQFLELRREAFSNDGRTPTATAYDINGTWDQNRYTDWEDVMIGGTANLTNAGVNLSGGTELTQFLIAGSYRKETTVFPGDYRDQKLSLQSNLTTKSANDRLTSSLSFQYTNDNNLLPTSDFASLIVIAPNAPAIYNSDGTLNWANSTWSNPFSLLGFKSTSGLENLLGSLNLNYKVLNGFMVTSRFGYNRLLAETRNIMPASSRNPANPITETSRRHTFGDKATISWIVEPAINYNRVFHGEI